jgi:hypothetical protein
MPPSWLSGLFGKQNRDGPDRDDEDEDSIQNQGNPQSAIRNPQFEDDPDAAPVSPLAMMNEKSPEAWLGRFLTILGAPPALQYSTIRAAKEDDRLTAHLQGIIESAEKDQPVRLLEPGYTEALKATDWAAWWRASEELGRYCYAILSLIMLGDTSHNSDLAIMYRQEANSRISKDAHYVICYILGKDWPGDKVTQSDLARLSQ